MYPHDRASGRVQTRESHEQAAQRCRENSLAITHLEEALHQLVRSSVDLITVAELVGHAR